LSTLTTAPRLALRGGGSLFHGPWGPVPYVTKWSAEQDLDAPLIETGRGIGYADEIAADRDLNGVLWSRVSSSPGVGEPLYRMMHSLRQRRAMRKLLCQVCGAPSSETDRGTLWLVRKQPDAPPGWPEGLHNGQPPLCVRCARISVRACPWLREGYVAVRAYSAISGAYGGLYRAGRSQPGPQPREARTLTFHDRDTRWLQASQLVRQLVDCTLVDRD
jgi:hypothetical protein